MENYDHKRIEKKWQKFWERKKVFKTAEKSDRKKFYVLDMFPYPSGEGLHVGHPKGYIATDVVSRMKRMRGFNVLHPMGFDAFGLPAENYAIKTKTNPSVAVAKNVERYKKQLEILGFDYDWSREINTTDPKYYKWTQWIFLQMLKRGLAYQSFEPINWCPSCKTGLANEDVEEGKCERCGTTVEKKPMRQWVLKITDYADRMLNDIPKLDWPESIKESQKNWIGRSEGVNLRFKVDGLGMEFEMYDSIPQTHMAQTFTVIAPEHPKLFDLVKGTEYEKPVMEKAKEIIAKRVRGGYESTDDMDGIFTGRYVDYVPAGRKLPIWVASFVVADYGTGVVNCSFHDERDYKFAKKFNIPLHPVLFPKDATLAERVRKQEIFYREPDGILEEPAEFKGRRWDEARQDIINYLVKKGWASRAVNYKIRDWVFSRQRYWGEPIPVIHCDGCKNRKQKVLIIHGFEGNPSGGWKPWLKDELTKLGFEVRVPALPNADHPNFREIFNFLKKETADFTADDIVIGHSMGGHFAAKLAEKKKLKKVILVAGAVGGTNLPYDTWEKSYPDSDNKSLKNLLLKNKANLKHLKAVEKCAIFGVDDLDVPVAIAEELDATWKVVKVDKVGHMDKISKLPELLKECVLALNTGVVPVPEKSLPVKLPKVKQYEPTGTGESPLAAISAWVNVKCPVCGGKAKRETNTMPQWAGSSWYYLRYVDPKNGKALVDKKKEDYWSPVDFYVGGAEHATRHLIYARFWHKFLFDIGVVSNEEPFEKLQHVGLIMAEDGRKMSKRYGNVVNPDDIVERFGADTLRLYEMFMGPFDQQISWSTQSMVGSRRFIEKAWRLKEKCTLKSGEYNADLEVLIHQTVKKVTEDIEGLRFNTAVSSLMILGNAMETATGFGKSQYETFLKLISPFAPHVAEELWFLLKNRKSICLSDWPVYDESKVRLSVVTIVVQINGKTRASFSAPADSGEEELKKTALALSAVQKWLGGGVVKKAVYVKGRLINFVI